MLIEQMKIDRIQAMKNGETIKKNLLSTLIGDCCKVNKEPSDVECIAMIKKFIKNAEETERTLNTSDHFGIGDIISKLVTEIEILESYLPKQLSEEKITEIINICISCGDTNLGQIMKHFKTECEGRYDGAVVSKIAKELLQKGIN